MKPRVLVCIIGGFGAGKSILADQIIIHDGFSKAISTTTRDRREGEHNDREYHFVAQEAFIDLKENNELVEYVKYDDNYYGLTKSELDKNDDNLVFIVDPIGFIQISNHIKSIETTIIPLVIYMDISEKDRFKNMVIRGVNPITIQDRLKTETITDDFKNQGIIPDIHITKLHGITSDSILSMVAKITDPN